MKVVVRTDANLTIGTGHLARCRVLAEHLRESAGAKLLFVCRALSTSAAQDLHEQGFSVAVLPEPKVPNSDEEGPPHRGWLTVSREQDAAETIAAMRSHGWAVADWVIVDHYALDAVWERIVRAHVKAMLAVDDLADRDHETDIVLDQNLRQDDGKAYHSRMARFTRLLCGPRYALLRDEFAARKRQPQKGNLFISFGGADSGNYTGKTMIALKLPALKEVAADIVVSSQHPALDELQAQADADARMRVHVNATRVSDYMIAAELGIGAGGVMTWERCAVGLPALATAIAQNQRKILEAVADAGAVCLLNGDVFEDSHALAAHIARMLADDETISSMSVKARGLCDARGAERVAALMCRGNVMRVNRNG